MTRPALETDDAPSSFPHLVAWGSLLLALLLFFGNTAPAVRERKALRANAEDLQRLRVRFDAALANAMPGTPGAEGGNDDMQSVLVALDRIGWTPEELLREYPEPKPRAATIAEAAPNDR